MVCKWLIGLELIQCFRNGSMVKWFSGSVTQQVMHCFSGMIVKWFSKMDDNEMVSLIEY